MGTLRPLAESEVSERLQLALEQGEAGIEPEGVERLRVVGCQVPLQEQSGVPEQHTVVGALPLGPPDVWLYSKYFSLVERRGSCTVP